MGKKNWSSWTQAKIICFASGSGQNLDFSFRPGSTPGQNFYLQAELRLQPFQAGTGLKNLARADL